MTPTEHQYDCLHHIYPLICGSKTIQVVQKILTSNHSNPKRIHAKGNLICYCLFSFNNWMLVSRVISVGISHHVICATNFKCRFFLSCRRDMADKPNLGSELRCVLVHIKGIQPSDISRRQLNCFWHFSFLAQTASLGIPIEITRKTRIQLFSENEQ